MSASIELQRAANLLMEAACASAAAEWMTDSELRADMLGEAERDVAEARRVIDNAALMLRRRNRENGDAYRRRRIFEC